MMILSALVFGRQLSREQVACRGITASTGQEVRQAVLAGAAPAGRDVRVLRARPSGRRDRPGTARGRSRRRPAGGYRWRYRSRGVPGKPDRRGHHHRAWRRSATRGPGSAQAHRRSRQMADKELISRGRGPVGASDPRCPSSPTLTGHNQASSAVRVTRPAACRSPRSVPDPKAASKASWPRRTAGQRAVIQRTSRRDRSVMAQCAIGPTCIFQPVAQTAWGPTGPHI